MYNRRAPLKRNVRHSNFRTRCDRVHQMKNLFRSSWILAFVICSAVLWCPVSLRTQQTTRRPPGLKSQLPVTKAQFDLGNSALRIPLEIDNNLILLRVNVNGSQPLKFIFDTSASISSSTINFRRLLKHSREFSRFNRNPYSVVIFHT